MKIISQHNSPDLAFKKIYYVEDNELPSSKDVTHKSKIYYTLPTASKAFKRCHSCVFKGDIIKCDKCLTYTFENIPSNYNIQDVEEFFNRYLHFKAVGGDVPYSFEYIHSFLFAHFVYRIRVDTPSEIKQRLARYVKAGMNVRHLNDMALRCAIFQTLPELVRILINNFNCKVSSDVLNYACCLGGVGGYSFEVLKDLMSFFGRDSEEINNAIECCSVNGQTLARKLLIEYASYKERDPLSIQISNMILG